MSADEEFNDRPRRRKKPGLRVLSGSTRELPKSLEAEENLLSCLLLDGADMVPRCQAAKLVSDSFYDSKHGIIYDAIVELYQSQRPTDVSCVAELLQTKKQLDQVGGYPFLTQVSARIPTTAQAGFFLEQVRQQWILRQIIRRSESLAESVYNYTGEPLAEFLSPHVVWFENALARLSHGGRGDVYTLEKRIAEVRADVALRAEGKEDRSGWVWTGFSAFDDLERDKCLRPFHSLEEDGIVLIGGGSSYGKSVLMRQWAGQALITGQRVLVYTLETSVKGFIRTLAANWAGVNLLMLHRTPRDLLKKFDDCIGELEELANKRLFLFQNEQGSEISTIEDLGRHARSWSMQHGAPHLVVMDYLQRLDTKKRYNNAEQRVAYVAHGFQSLQRELNCCAMGGAQLNEQALREMRTVKRDADGKIIHTLPNRGALRESQALYHDADVVIFLHVPVEDCRGADQTDVDLLTPETWLVQDKRRNGVRGIARCWFEKKFSRFKELGAAEVGLSDKSKLSTTGTVPPGQKVSKRDYREGGGGKP